jgi:23S rRNA-/tRNA-specific pseudouridylate synthase
VVLFCPHAAKAMWAEHFAEGTVQKRYLALVFGQTRDKGIIRRALADGRRSKPLEAVTRYRTLEKFSKWSLLSVRPETGRKHQIRRHLQGIGHAVIGDTRYLPRGRPTVPAFPGRLWLHAERIEIDGRTFEAPLAPELEAHLAVLRSRG